MQANSTEQDFTPDDPRVFDQYLQDGVICLRNVLNESWLTRLKEGTRDAIEQGGPHHFRFGTPNAPGFFFGDVMLWQRWPSFCEFAFDGPLASLAGHLMNSQSVTFYHDFLLVKNAGSSKPTPWHQDQSYWCVGGDQALTIWAPLDAVSSANTLEFVRGSHRWNTLYAAVPFADESSFDGSRDGRPEVPDIALCCSDEDIVSWSLQPGDCLAFHARTLHRAPGNPLPHPRRVLSTCWAGDDAHYIEIASDLAPPIKGDGLIPGAPLACSTFPRIF
ncbi:phytanoyl-CoA dioxygenase family protein [Vreelandella sedimenti]|uniref:phytanoyl-CoA dioxygenase family protein n=1 Tax=Vreelandella sedimenti TaxID=2729618 RepID=UPI00257F22DB|nr:phytanoyl-CoA dioxygenase family protein [Halomonas sp. UBA3173]|tara:strand:+ start:7306 stop:8130 length:825 start_codon:yes stop_codon:yes gene_type:complete